MFFQVFFKIENIVFLRLAFAGFFVGVEQIFVRTNLHIHFIHSMSSCPFYFDETGVVVVHVPVAVRIRPIISPIEHERPHVCSSLAARHCCFILSVVAAEFHDRKHQSAAHAKELVVQAMLDDERKEKNYLNFWLCARCAS